MRKLISTALLAGSFACMALPALADISIKDVKISQNATDNSVHIVLTNTDDYVVDQGKMNVSLLVRKSGDSDWVPVKTWNDQILTVGLHDVSLDSNSASSPALKAMLGKKAWEAKVTIQGPHNFTAERTFPYSGGDAATR